MKWLLLYGLFLSSCTLQKSGSWRLPNEIPESSALAHHNGTLITLNDSGNSADLFLLKPEGKKLSVQKVAVPNATNRDWEALAIQGNVLWIGDIGNNRNARKDLALYKVSLDEAVNAKITNAQRYSFAYPDQKVFPPEPENRLYDAEALIAIDTNLYIFTKNRTKPFTGAFHIYRLNASSDSAMMVTQLASGQLKAGKPAMRYRITDADISPDGNILALLAPDRIWFFRVINGTPDFSKPIKIKRFAKKSVREAICFTSNEHIAISSETYKIWKARLWMYRIKLKSK